MQNHWCPNFSSY